jgi:hypothetical protein
MRDHRLFSRVRNAVSSVETGNPFSRGTFERREMAVGKSPAIEGISQAWRLREENLRLSGDGIDITPTELEDVDLIGIRAEPVTLSCRRLAVWEADMFEFGHQSRRNGGRKPRASSRETIRNMRTLSHEEQLLAGDSLREENEVRKARRNARVCKRTVVTRLPSPEFNLGAERKAA